MQSQNELRNLLQRIDHKSYPAYKDTRGSYDLCCRSTMCREIRLPRRRR